MIAAQHDITADRTRPRWHRDVLDDLAQRLSAPSAFPCTFSQNAFRRELVQFAFVEDNSATAMQAASDSLAAYVRDSRSWDGSVNTARPLIMAFSESAARFDDLAGYHRFGWSVLQRLHDLDPAPWPAETARHPDQPFWSFCHSGVQLFVNMSTPAHRIRQSRNLGRHFLFVINPRERFDLIAGDTPEGHRLRRQIRRRSAAYDKQPHAPQLGSYQKAELEWVQYALPDRNEDTTGLCPFRTKTA